MLDSNLKTQLKAYLEKITQPIELVASLDASEKSRELQSLLQEISTLSDKITLIERFDDAERKPSFSINRPAGGVGIRFAGIPMGHEFTSLVLALLQTGGHPPKVDADTIEQIAALEGDYLFETYISLTCQNCPEVVQSLNLMAVLNPQCAFRGHRRRAVPGRNRAARDHGGADHLPERPGIRPGPPRRGRNPGQTRHQFGQPRSGKNQCQGAVRHADRRRRPGRRRRRRVCGAQGHPHRRGGRALRRPGAGHDGDRELHLGAGNRRAALCRRPGAPRAQLRCRHHQPATRGKTGAGRSDRNQAGQRRSC